VDANEQPAWALPKSKRTELLLEHVGGWQWVGCLLLGVAGIFALVFVINIWRADTQLALGKRLREQNQGLESLSALQRAVTLSPIDEGVYHEQVADIASELTIVAYKEKNATAAGQFGELALSESDKTLQLNPNNLNFYRSRTRVLITLAQAAPQLLKDALKVMDTAQTLSPTDPKITYNRALLNESLGNSDLAIQLLKKAIEMKPNYDGAKEQLRRIQEGK
jgi:tetratricopeptide (TPR) repeat protein